MKISTERPNDNIDILYDDRVNKIVDLLLKDDSKVYIGITRIINTIYSYDELLYKAENIFNIYNGNNLSRFYEYWSALCNIYKDHHKDDLRGAILERFGYKLLKMKYGKRCYNDVRCLVWIDSWCSDESVDLFFYEENRDIGETCECKVNPIWLENFHIKNLRDIFYKSDRKIYPVILSFSSIDAVECILGELRVSIKEKEITYFGYENLKKIVNFRY